MAPQTPRTRRQILTAAIAAAGGALATQALARPETASAANVVLGGTNTAGSVTTIRSNQASVSARALSGQVLYTGAGGSTAGVHGQSNAQNGNGVFGVSGPGPVATGVWGRTGAGRGVFGEATGIAGVNTGVRGSSSSTSGIGVHGTATRTTGGTYGVLGAVASPSGRGVQGTNTATNGTGVFGLVQNGNNAKAVLGRTTAGIGVYGEALGTGSTNFGVYGSSAGTSGRGVYGQSTNTSSGVGVYGLCVGNGAGVLGYAQGPGFGYAVSGLSEKSTGVLGTSLVASGFSAGVYGNGYSPDGAGVYGDNTYGGKGVYAHTYNGIALYADGDDYAPGDDAFAGWFIGNTHVAGTLSKTAGTFLIDHPLDPANRTLAHSFVESPEMLNVYRGTVTLNTRGRATVRLPRYFEALNRDFAYQLTALDAAAPGLHVARRISRNSFAVAGGSPGQDVCWQVTGARQDAWARANPLRVERPKRRKHRGQYLNPEAFGESRSSAINYQPRPARITRREVRRLLGNVRRDRSRAS
jgi:hypothetical protein